MVGIFRPFTVEIILDYKIESIFHKTQHSLILCYYLLEMLEENHKLVVKEEVEIKPISQEEIEKQIEINLEKNVCFCMNIY